MCRTLEERPGYDRVFLLRVQGEGSSRSAPAVSTPVELLLIRHGLPVRKERVDGPADPELDEQGRAQAVLLADYLASESFNAIYSSPLRRALETAAPLADAQGLEVSIADGVAEFDRHANSYVPVEELRANNDPRWKEMLSGSREDSTEFRALVIETVTSIVSRHKGEKVAVVCHAGVIGAYLADVLGVTMTGPSFFAPNYTSIHRVMASRSGNRSIHTLNETAHLRGAGLRIGLYE